jgi:hypothetical protein
MLAYCRQENSTRSIKAQLRSVVWRKRKTATSVLKSPF